MKRLFIVFTILTFVMCLLGCNNLNEEENTNNYTKNYCGLHGEYRIEDAVTGPEEYMVKLVYDENGNVKGIIDVKVLEKNQDGNVIKIEIHNKIYELVPDEIVPSLGGEITTIEIHNKIYKLVSNGEE